MTSLFSSLSGRVVLKTGLGHTTHEVTTKTHFSVSALSSTTNFSKELRSPSCQTAIKLHYDVISNAQLSSPILHPNVPCVLLHGLLGSGRNLRSLVKALPFETFILPDLRNHGRSLHCPNMSMDLMAADVIYLLDQLKISEARIIGHSMGGKVAMAIALSAPTRVASLAVLDVAPVYDTVDRIEPEKINPRLEILSLLDLLNSVPLETFQTKKGVEQWLLNNHKGPRPLTGTLLQFLLQNLNVSNDSTKLSWFPNISTLQERFESDILHWPYEGHQFARAPVVFVKGQRSPWIQTQQIETIHKFFPKAQIKVVDATHWLHHEAPEDVAAQIIEGWKLPSIEAC